MSNEHQTPSGLPALLQVVKELRAHGRIADDEGEMTNQLADLAAWINTRAAEIARAKENYKTLAHIVHDQVVANQSAWIEWQHGKGAEAAMTWVHNGLAGPGQIPDETEPYGKEPQAWYDLHNSNALPPCFCGRPSNTGWMGFGFCSHAHYLEGKARTAATAADTTGGAA